MGLDMYLENRIYVGFDARKNLVISGIDVDASKVSYIIEEAGYWRKVNAIHNWFVKNVQDGEDDCGEYYVSEVHLQDLLDIVNDVLEDHSKAEELLPTQSGFFFGATDYGQYYFQDLQDTKEILEKAINSKDGSFYYHSSW